METSNSPSSSGSANTPLEDLRQDALDHYSDLSNNAQSYLCTVPKAINFYFDSLVDGAKIKEEVKENGVISAKLRVAYVIIILFLYAVILYLGTNILISIV